MRIDALRLRAITERGVMQRELRFGPGLNLLRADNTSGKSTALMALIYALGLEGMLNPGARVPLAHAMTDRIDVNGVSTAVRESDVTLELSNADGQTITVTRSVKSATRSGQLVTVLNGPAITRPGDYLATDYFVRRPGAAQNDAGFHRFLAGFLNLNLPQVVRVDGSEVPLYLETVFPYFFVEQKHGWSSIQARIPTYLGIRDVHKRSAEFVLGLDAFERIRQRQRFKSNMSQLEAEWHAVNRESAELARLSDVVIRNVPARISRGLAESEFQPSVNVDGNWLAIESALERYAARIASEEDRVPSVGETAPAAEERLEFLEQDLRERLAVAASVAAERGEQERQLQQMRFRLEALSEDLQRHKDAEVLTRLGSEHAHELIADHVCPTCHQELSDGADISAHAMTVAENIDLIKRQIATFEATAGDIERVLEAFLAREASLRRDIRETRSEIRAARDALTSANATPSVADVARRYSLAKRMDDLSVRAEDFASLRNRLSTIASDWRRQQGELSRLGSGELSASDATKLAALQRSIRDQLGSYGFSSLNPEEVDIDNSTYRPTHEGFDLGFDLSASDMIRVIWAYLFGMLNVSRELGGNHIGLLVFDEPRQQETARPSYSGLLRHAAEAGESGNQILFATSEPLDSLRDLIGVANYNLIHLEPGEKLLTLSPDSSARGLM